MKQRLKIDFYKCMCGFQTTLKSEVNAHLSKNFKVIEGMPTLYNHGFKNLRYE